MFLGLTGKASGDSLAAKEECNFRVLSSSSLKSKWWSNLGLKFDILSVLCAFWAIKISILWLILPIILLYPFIQTHSFDFCWLVNIYNLTLAWSIKTHLVSTLPKKAVRLSETAPPVNNEGLWWMSRGWRWFPRRSISTLHHLMLWRIGLLSTKARVTSKMRQRGPVCHLRGGLWSNRTNFGRPTIFKLPTNKSSGTSAMSTMAKMCRKKLCFSYSALEIC